MIAATGLVALPMHGRNNARQEQAS